MAQFDLKQADIYIRDGFSGAGAVNNASGYTNQSTMTMDGYTGIIPVGATFTVVGDTAGRHTVTAHTETTGNTTSITFTPALNGTIADNAVITFGGREMKIKVGDGNVTFSEKRMIEYKKDRGKLDTVRLGDEDPVDVKLDLRWEHLSSESGAEIPTPREALRKEGPASDWVSSSSDPCEPYAVDIEIRYSPFCTDQDKELILLPDYRWESLDMDAKAGTLSTSGKCNVIAVTATRVTAF